MESGAVKLQSSINQTASVYLEVLSGLEKGKRIDLRGVRISLGRADDNDVIAMAEGVSRRHAFMAVSENDWFIRDNESKNGVVVNGEKLAESWLSDGDIVALGDFVFRFHAPKLGGDVYGNPANLPMSGAVGELGGEFGALPSAAPTGGAVGAVAAAPAAGKKPGVNRRVLIYGGVGLTLVMLFLLSSGNEPTTEGTETVSATERLSRDFDVSKVPTETLGNGKKVPLGLEDPMLKKAEQEMSSLDWADTSLQQAELFFRRGQRDYLAKNYHRSIEAFQTALSLYKGHSLAERYLRHAIAETEVEAKNNMATGVRYFEALQYQRAIYHFRAAIQLMAHRPEEPMVKEAQRYIQQAELRLRAAELFP